MSVNKTPWSSERVAAYKRFLLGDEDATFHGVKRSGKKYAKATAVRGLVAKFKFSTTGGKLFVTNNDGKKLQIITPKQVISKAQAHYKNKTLGVGKAPSIYNYMKTKYAGFGYKSVEAAVKALPSYQKYQARHLAKKKSRTVIIPRGPGEEIDTDLMFFSSEYYAKRPNGNMQGLVVVVDRFSGYIAIRPVSFGEKQKSAEVVAEKVEDILTSAGFPRKRGTIFHDNGVEFRGVFKTVMAQMGYDDVVISQAAGAPSPHAERAVGIIRKLVNQKLSAQAKPKKKTQIWWPMVRPLIASYNRTPQTDARAPHTPLELTHFAGPRAAVLVRKLQKAGAKRLGMAKNSRQGPGGSRVQKTLKVLHVDDYVRHATEQVRKTGANKRPWPKQRWSNRVYQVRVIHNRQLGFARYSLRGLPRRRFEREDLQLVRKSAVGAQPGDSDESADAGPSTASKRTARYQEDV